ncbi:MAG: type I DNA topoisomerase, partial [Patescibacteria group bacterium]
MKLVIVESPTKARKLSGYLGKEFEVESSVGHVRDLPRKKLSVDEETFEPVYEVSEDKQKVVSLLKRLAKKSDEIILAMDPDREGEAIAWHLEFILKGPKANFKRATFNEITKAAVLKAIENPGKLNMDLVDAQQARRVLDRLVGYKLSPVLWKKVRRGLSAGRVQSVALRLIVEKEKEIQAFKAEEYWELDVLLDIKNKEKRIKKKDLEKDGLPEWLKDNPEDSLIARVIEVAGKKYEPKKESQVTGVVESLKDSDYKVDSVEKKERKRASLPPFTTSTLQQTAANRLGMTSKQSMRFAQQLYEEGLITYHRTDSVNLSTQAVSMARGYVESQFGKKYLPNSPRVFKKKSKSAQEAHEAIRVTDVMKLGSNIKEISSKFGPRHEKLYDLIWRRFLASQMETALYDQTSILVRASKKNILLKTTGSVLKFDGWMKLFPNAGDNILPAVEKDQSLYYLDLHAAQKFTQPPARYNDASLVKELEKRGIGRPSTYASIISVIVDRGNVERQ